MPDPRTIDADVVVIGGGASGLAAAIAAARAGAHVAVLERDVACGLPILATGNGRCNVSNVRLDPARYRDAAAARAVLGETAEDDLARFFESMGLMTCPVEDRLYPVTLRAESVRDVLLAVCEREGVQMLCGAELTEMRREGTGWRLTARCPERPVRPARDVSGKLDVRRARKALAAAPMGECEVAARCAVVAVGGASARICELIGLPHVDELPVLCPVACEPALSGTGSLSTLDGLRVEGALTVVRASEDIYREEGEVLFRGYGLSGVVVFDLSRRVRPGDTLELDLFPRLSTGDLMGLMRSREEVLGTFDGGDAAWFDGMLARPLASFVLGALAADVEPGCDGMRGDLVTRTAKLLHRLPFAVVGTAEHKQAQVRRGGIPLTAVKIATLQAAPGLFACGEALDQDADCGGYNLAWAWASGMRAGVSAANAAAAR